MKAQVLKAPGLLTYEDVNRPSVDSEVLIRITHSGICGTDLKIYRGSIQTNHPLIMGHEMVGEVIDSGSGQGFGEGARVIVDPVLFCSTCFYCRSGQTNLCPNGGLLGRDRDGGFSDYVTVPESNVHLLPPGIDDRVAPLIQVLTTCLHAHRLVQVFPGESVAVLGLGVTGQLHIQLAKAQGAYPVIGITRSAWKRELAERLGADIILPADDTAKDTVLEATNGRGADLVIEAVGAVPAMAEAITLARTGGRLLLFGVTTTKEGALPFYLLYFKELALISSRAAKSEDYPSAIDLVNRGTIQLKPLISHTMSLGELGAALGLLASKKARSMKVILDHS